MACPLHAQQSSPLVGPRPAQAGDEQKIVNLTNEGYLSVYTSEIPVYDDDGFALSSSEQPRYCLAFAKRALAG